MTPASIIPVFGSQRPYADLNFAGGSFGLDGRSVRDLTALPGFTFTRASLAMGYDATGKLVYGPNNLCLQSQTFDNAAWVKAQSGAASVPVVTANTEAAPDGTLTADTVAFTLNGGTADGDISQLQQAITSPGPSLFSFWAKTTDGLSKVFTVVGNGGTIVTITITGVWQRFTAPEPLVGSATARLRLRGSASGEGTAASASICLWGAQLEAVTYQTTPSTYYPTTTAAYYGPRLVYDPVTLASQGILVEEARTNLLTQSQNLATALTVSNSVLTAAAATSPDGTVNATSLMENAANASHWAYHTSVNGVSATTYTYSLFIKDNGRSAVWLNVQASPNNYFTAVFDLSGVSVSQTSVGSTSGTISASSIQSVGNGWYRCVVTGVVTGTSSFCVGLATAPTGNTFTTVGVVSAYVGDITKGAYIWQIQVEAAVGASSPIPTTTAAVTRAADVAAVTGLSLAYPLSITVDAYRALDKGADEFWAQVDDGAATNRTVVQVNPSDKLEVGVATGGAGQGSSTSAASVPVGATSKAAARLATNSIAGALNGVLSPEDTAATMPSGPANLRIGSNQSGQAQPNYTISRIRIYNRALPDAQLQSLTT